MISISNETENKTMKLQETSVWKVGKLFAFLVGAVFTALTTTAATFSMVADIPYANDSDASHVGNLYLPKKVASSTPIVLTIHGGGWASGDRASWRLRLKEKASRRCNPKGGAVPRDNLKGAKCNGKTCESES